MGFSSFDGTEIAFVEIGEGRPLLLVHGLFSTAEVNWVKYGTAQKLVDSGWRLILPDLRGHGDSAAPPEAGGWPEDVLAQDIEALIAHLSLDPAELVIGGYSLGARTVVRLLARGLRPRAAILAGMGLDGITGAAARSDWYLHLIARSGTFRHGDPYFMADAFMRANVKNPGALEYLLRRQLNTDRKTLKSFDLPVLVVCGAEDDDNGSAAALAAVLPVAEYVEISGTHMSAVTKPALGDAMVAYLGRLRP